MSAQMEPAHLSLGYLQLCDAAPLIVAVEKGFFADESLRVSLVREVSWATLRDKLTAGALDGAHILGPMVLAGRLGLFGSPLPLVAAMPLNRGGAAIALRPEIAPEDLADVVVRRVAEGRPRLTLATVFPYSIHTYLLRRWLADADVDPDRDVRLVTAAPSRMLERMATGEIDGFCAGAPWPSLARATGLAKPAVRVDSVWPDAPDKVLAVRDDFADRRPALLPRVMRAVIRAAIWADDPAHRTELKTLLSPPDAVGMGVMAPGALDGVSFSADSARTESAAAAFAEDATWTLRRMAEAGQIPLDGQGVESAAVDGVFRVDLYADALRSLKI